MLEAQNGWVLVIGGSSSVGVELREQLSIRGGRVIWTYGPGSDSNSPTARNERKVFLDLGDRTSCLQFVEEIRMQPVSSVVLLAGRLSTRGPESRTSIDFVSRYFQTYLSNYCWLVRAVLESSERRDLVLVNLSSRSASRGSWDEYYAAVKAGMDAFLFSLKKNHFPDVRFTSLVAGLIVESGMSKDFSEQDIHSHVRRAGQPLLSVNQVAAEIVAALDRSEGDNEFSKIIGPDYQ